MFRKFTDTLTNTLDNVKTYSSSISFGSAAVVGTGVGAALVTAQQKVSDAGQKAASETNGSKFPISLPSIVSNGGAPPSTTAANPPNATPSPGQAASSTSSFFALPTLGRRSADAVSNPIVVQSASKGQKGPALGTGFDTGESRIHKMNGSANMLDARLLSSEQRAASYQNIDTFEQYQEAAAHKKTSSAGISRLQTSAPSPRPNGSPSLTRSDTDEIIDTDFEKLKSQLDDVLDVPEEKDDSPPKVRESADEPAEPTGPMRFAFLRKIVAVIQDDRVKGGCVEAHELIEVTQGRDSHYVLKKVLNISFLTLGLLLFAAVIIVIIYTNVADTPSWLQASAHGEEAEDVIPLDFANMTDTDLSR